MIVANARKLFVAPPAYGGHPCSSPSASLRAVPAGATISALPRSVRAISQSQTKSDREDAQMLALPPAVSLSNLQAA